MSYNMKLENFLDRILKIKLVVMSYNMKLENFLDMQTYKHKARREQHYTVLSR